MARLEATFWWYQGLHRLTLRWLRRHGIGPQQRVLDAGCGTGGLLALLKGCRACGLDAYGPGLELAAARGLQCLAQGSVEALPFRDQSFDTVISHDVLYHRLVASDVAALHEFRRVLRPGGLLLLNLPALECLRGAHDLAVWTRRRYTVRELRDKLAEAGLHEVRLTYRNTLLFPLAAAARLTSRSGTRSDVRPLPRWLNTALLAVLDLENRLLDWVTFPVGLSVFCVARRGVG